MKLGVVKEFEAGERRVAASLETVKKFIALGASVAVETGAGVNASISDAAYADAGAIVGDRTAIVADADILLAIQSPDPASLVGVKPGTWLVGNLDPFARSA